MNRLARSHLRLIFQVGARHLGLGRGGIQAAPALAVAGSALGTATLLVVLAVMNGFQLNFIEAILEVGSYHVRVTGAAAADPDLPQVLAAAGGVTAVVPFTEFPALIRTAGRAAAPSATAQSAAAPSGPARAPRGLLVRVLPPQVVDLDPGFARHTPVVAGRLELGAPGAIVIGAELAAHLGVLPGDRVTLVTLGDDALQLAPGGAIRPRQVELAVGGIFRSGHYDYDLGRAFIGPATARAFFGGGPTVLGIKLANRFQDRAAVTALRAALAARATETAAAADADAAAGAAAEVESWRHFNRALFAALRVEKLLLSTILGLVFVVVAYNVLQGLRRRVVERGPEMGLLRALGAPPWVVRGVFLWEGVLLGLGGAAAGTGLGLLLAHNIGGLFSLLETVANAALAVAAALRGAGGGAPPPAVAIFSPLTFYITEVPSRLIFSEVLLVAAFAVAAPALSGALAAVRAARVAAAEVLGLGSD